MIYLMLHIIYNVLIYKYSGGQGLNKKLKFNGCNLYIFENSTNYSSKGLAPIYPKYISLSSKQ